MLSLPFSAVQVIQSKAEQLRLGVSSSRLTHALCKALLLFFPSMTFLVSFQPISISTDVVMGLGPKIHLSLLSYFPWGWGAWKTARSHPLQGLEPELELAIRSPCSRTVGCRETRQCLTSSDRPCCGERCVLRVLCNVGE